MQGAPLPSSEGEGENVSYWDKKRGVNDGRRRRRKVRNVAQGCLSARLVLPLPPCFYARVASKGGYGRGGSHPSRAPWASETKLKDLAER